MRMRAMLDGAPAERARSRQHTCYLAQPSAVPRSRSLRTILRSGGRMVRPIVSADRGPQTFGGHYELRVVRSRLAAGIKLPASPDRYQMHVRMWDPVTFYGDARMWCSRGRGHR